MVDSLLANTNITDIIPNGTATVNGSLNYLFIQASREYNNTVIECVIIDTQDGKREYSSATLKVQGWLSLPKSVASFQVTLLLCGL